MPSLCLWRLKSMDSSGKWLVVAFAAAAIIIAGLLLRGGDDTEDVVVSPTPTVSAAPTIARTATPTPTPVPKVWDVHMTLSGAAPATLTIRAGDSVRFINDTEALFWPASDPHPTHTMCPGFDANRGLRFGESYVLRFATARTCTYHDHLNNMNALRTGSVIVQ